MLKENQAFEKEERSLPKDCAESEKLGLRGMKSTENLVINSPSIEVAFQKRRQEVEAILTAFLPEEKGPAKTGIEAMNYSLMVRGETDSSHPASRGLFAFRRGRKTETFPTLG